MTFIEAVLTVLVPAIPVVLPGAFFIRALDWNNLLVTGVRIMLWSMSILTLLLTAGLYGGISVTIIALVIFFLGAFYLIRHRKDFFARHTLWHAFAIIVPMALGVMLFTIPFLVIHDGLPTGDVQKTIIWASDSITTHRLPNYASAVSFLNRDPVDFYTPGLHAVAALVMSLSPAPLTSMGIFSIVIAVCVAWIAGALTKEMFDNHPHIIPPILAGIFTLTQYRFLRYLREPGYHFQNVVGEFFLFGMLLFFIRFIRRRDPYDALLFIVSGAALFLTHQFSAFIAVFAIAAASIATILEYRSRIIRAAARHRHITGIAGLVGILGLGIAFSLGLSVKIPTLFTSTPRLTSLLPRLVDYPATMGEVWFFVGVIGVVLMVVEARRKDAHHRQVIAFASACAALLVLSQGPAIGIDIPPVRALFYLAVPLSIGAAYFFGKLFLAIKHTYNKRDERIAWAVLSLAIVLACGASTYKSYASLSHTVRTNSTLTGEQLGLIEQLRSTSGNSAVLIDDYNRRSASWLVLAGKPMFTRIAADIERQMNESSQGKLRRELYINQLDYEKIFALGSLPEIAALSERLGVGYVAGVQNISATAFDQNQLLQPMGNADDLILYTIKKSANICKENPECVFLTRSATLANDIGDTQDTFLHLMASVRSAQMSDPIIQHGTTYRNISASKIPLVFNVGNYVRALWDPNNIGRPETGLSFVLRLQEAVPGLSIVASSGERIALSREKNSTISLSPNMVRFDERGFITLTIDNPQRRIIGIDVIALGPSLTQ